MKHQVSSIPIDFLKSFPRSVHRNPRNSQKEALGIIAAQMGSVLIEAPTGSGKTAIGLSFLNGMKNAGHGPLFYVTPTKAAVDQIVGAYPNLSVAYGRGEHPCLYYEQDFAADEVPCSLLRNCPHRVCQLTGRVTEPGSEPCPYLQQKYEARTSGNVVVCTTAFYLFNQLFMQDWETPAGLVIDEVHRLPSVVRNCLTYDITDYHLERSREFLKSIGAEKVAGQIEEFRKKMVHIVLRRSGGSKTVLEDHELKELIDVLSKIDGTELRKSVTKAITSGTVSNVDLVEALKKIETLIFSLSRYMHAFEYSMTTPGRHALNYTFAYYESEPTEGTRVRHKLCVKSYLVAPLINKRLLSPFTVAYSATIGDHKIFSQESGIDFPFYSLASQFPVKNTGIYLPTDTPDLSMKSRPKREPTKVLRRIAKICRSLANKGIRTSLITISNAEMEKFIFLCGEEGVDVVSCGNGVSPREAISNFKSGVGDTLVGTEANLAESTDLPGGISPVIFVLRPGYPRPDDPQTKFEEKRFGFQRWGIWQWRVMIKALQARGRNIRGKKDKGVTIFVSQQFNRFLLGSLPTYLKPAFSAKMTLDECVDAAVELLEE